MRFRTFPFICFAVAMAIFFGCLNMAFAGLPDPTSTWWAIAAMIFFVLAVFSALSAFLPDDCPPWTGPSPRKDDLDVVIKKRQQEVGRQGIGAYDMGRLGDRDTRSFNQSSSNYRRDETPVTTTDNSMLAAMIYADQSGMFEEKRDEPTHTEPREQDAPSPTTESRGFDPEESRSVWESSSSSSDYSSSYDSGSSSDNSSSGGGGGSD